MKNLIMFAAIAALVTFSACKKAETTETPAETQETTEQAAAATEAASDAVAPVVDEINKAQ